MSNLADTKIFNNSNVIISGWYWALRASELRKGKATGIRLFGKELVVYRGESGRVYAIEAYCPHMGAHLKDGRVEGESIRCVFHNWRFESDGSCSEIPCQKAVSMVPELETHPVAEEYGIIWVHTGREATHPVPYVPELKGMETDWRLGNRFVKECHPNVVMINAIDAQHFNTVHPMVRKLAGNLFLEPVVINESNIEFRNNTNVPRDWWLGRLLSRFYAGPLTYWMSYWYASTGSVTVGPDFLHFHIIFALRMTEDGKTEGQTILVTRRRRGLLGRLASKAILKATEIVGNYFAKGDTMIFKSIRFRFRTPVREDHAIIRFIQHAEAQEPSAWRSAAQGAPECRKIALALGAASKRATEEVS
jgi:phenylpropionate dioxygenase-like ring-hydroxylating dioxygenase large terminal subunit